MIVIGANALIIILYNWEWFTGKASEHGLGRAPGVRLNPLHTGGCSLCLIKRTNLPLLS